MDEFGLIDRIARHGLQRPQGVICGIGDDCAVLESSSGQALLMTTDAMVEGVHFLADTPASEIGYKLLAVSLSDVAAMGGEPRDAVVTVAAPRNTPEDLIDSLYEGLRRGGRLFNTNIVGGDTVRSPGPLVYNLTLTGRMAADRVCFRSGAAPGDLIYVSETVGESAAGLHLRLGEKADLADIDRAALLRRHHLPIPRVGLGMRLAATGAVSSMIDLSDGIASDLRHICNRSKISAVVEAGSLPISASLKAFETATGKKAIDLALSGGEDYELLFTVPAERVSEIESLAADADLPPLTCIGRVEAARSPGTADVELVAEDGSSQPLTPSGFQHFEPPEEAEAPGTP